MRHHQAYENKAQTARGNLCSAYGVRIGEDNRFGENGHYPHLYGTGHFNQQCPDFRIVSVYIEWKVDQLWKSLSQAKNNEHYQFHNEYFQEDTSVGPSVNFTGYIVMARDSDSRQGIVIHQRYNGQQKQHQGYHFIDKYLSIV